jgi:ribonuclease HI
MQFYKDSPAPKRPRVLEPLVINKSMPWALFDGSCQGNTNTCGLGIVLYLSPSHHFLGKFNIGLGTNNLAKFSALFALMKSESKKEVMDIHIFGDSNICNIG